MHTMPNDFSTITLVLIPVAIAINIAVGQIIYTLKILLYLDSIGTVLVGVLAGLWTAGFFPGRAAVGGLRRAAPTGAPGKGAGLGEPAADGGGIYPGARYVYI